MFVFIPGSIPPVRFGPAGTDPAEISIPAVTYTSLTNQATNTVGFNVQDYVRGRSTQIPDIQFRKNGARDISFNIIMDI